MSAAFVLKTYRVVMDGSTWLYHCRSRPKAMGLAWRDYTGARGSYSPFRDFLRQAACLREPNDERFGEAIMVGGKPAFWVSCNRQYIQFVRPDSDVVMNSHPYDVEPPEARRGTPYYEPAQDTRP